MHSKKWIKLFFTIPTISILLILTFNITIDPYSVTNYNLLNIPNKFARDDRVEKVAKIKSSKKFDNIILGSSRVYGTNPLMVSHYLGGNTYNCGVGTARVEDILGFLLLLERENKLPKNLIIGLDFYSFNQEVESNKYFLKNRDLNFFANTTSNNQFIANFLSIDAIRASFKTLMNFLKNSHHKPRFDKYGAAGGASNVFEYFNKSNAASQTYSVAQVNKELQHIKTLNYNNIALKRIKYIHNIVVLCHKYSIHLYLFITPIHADLLKAIEKDKHLNTQFKKLKAYLQEESSFYNFMTTNSITQNSNYFSDMLHFNAIGGNLIYATLFNDNNVSIDSHFYEYYPRIEANKKNNIQNIP